jgi:hypothetical protein
MWPEKAAPPESRVFGAADIRRTRRRPIGGCGAASATRFGHRRAVLRMRGVEAAVCARSAVGQRWAMMIIGFAGCGFVALRRERQKTKLRTG